MSDRPHGTYARYVGGCRCGGCRAASAAYMRGRVEALRRAPEKQVLHGTLAGYTNYRCRCDRCRAANAAYHRGYGRRLRAEPGRYE